jgi:hypothetical protein
MQIGLSTSGTKINPLSLLVHFHLTSVSTVLEYTMLLPFVERNICDLEDVIENVQGLGWCDCFRKERMQTDTKIRRHYFPTAAYIFVP